MDSNKLTITINPNDFLISLNKSLTEASNAVFIGLSALDNLTELPEFIYGEDNFMIHQPYGIELNIDHRKKLYRHWLISKGFEDLIKAVTVMLTEICKVLSINSKLKETKTWEEFQKLIETPNHEITLKHYPELLKLIKPNLTEELLLEHEMNSINRVRRCLVHRNGLITPLDFYKGETTLKLCWVYFKISYEDNGIEKNIQQMKPIPLTSNLNFKITREKRVKEFKVNENVEITYQIFNELIMTCFLFGEDLITKLQIGENN